MLYVVQHGLADCTTWSYEHGDGWVAAALVTFQHKSVRHFYTIHYDPRWEWYSPGQCLIFEVTRESLKEGLDVDFMTGEYPYKNRLATAMVPLYRVAASAQQVAEWNAAAPTVATPAA
jgi:CelD/BcsL family acetyltransferase involved in cellulose biosynthesis